MLDATIVYKGFNEEAIASRLLTQFQEAWERENRFELARLNNWNRLVEKTTKPQGSTQK